MKIVACVKQVGVASDEIAFVADGREVDPDYLDVALNEWDACALEQALQLVEAHGGEVVAMTVGDEAADAALRRALALGAVRAVRVEGGGSDPIAVAHALAAAIRGEQPDLVLCGAQSSDVANGATPAALAALLDLAFAAVAVAVAGAGGTLLVERELEGGLRERVELDLPALVSVQTGIVQPRYVTFRALKAADAAEIDLRGPVEVRGAARVRRLALPERAASAELLTGDAAAVAARIVELVAERRSA